MKLAPVPWWTSEWPMGSSLQKIDRVESWERHILVPRGRAPVGQHQESQPLALWQGPTPEVCDSRTSRHSVHTQNQVSQIWLVLVSIYYIYKAIQNRNVVGPGQSSRFLVLTKRSVASEDENEKGTVMIVHVPSGWLASSYPIRLALLQHISWRVAVESAINERKSYCHFAWRNGSIAAWMFVHPTNTAVILAFLSIKSLYFHQHQNIAITRCSSR